MQIGGMGPKSVKIIEDEEMKKILKLFNSYGKQYTEEELKLLDKKFMIIPPKKLGNL